MYRNKDAYYFLTSENEWYKAAYQQNDGVTANYWDYATASNSMPTAVGSGTGVGTAVYNEVASVPASVFTDGGLSPYGTMHPIPLTTHTGRYPFTDGGLSPYGTMGQGGNVYEWTESAYDGINNSPSASRGIRGGDWGGTGNFLRSSSRGHYAPSYSSGYVGFRVASVPEPSAAVLMISAGVLGLARRRTRAAL